MPAEGPVERARALTELIRSHADRSEQERRLVPEIARAFTRTGLYRLAAVKSQGGEAADPITQIEVIEAVSRADGSAGWNLMIGIESFGLIAPAFDQCADLIADPEVVLSSSTAAVGRADRVDGGYRVSGQWQFVSGVHNSQIFGATVTLYHDDEPITDPPRVYALVMEGDFEILDTWHVGGMRGSGSHDVRVNDVFVPDSHVIKHIGLATGDEPLLRFPLGPRLSYNKVAVALGIARHALDEFYLLARDKRPRFTSTKLKHRPMAHRAIATAEVGLRAGRALLMELTGAMWQKVIAGERIEDEERALFHIACSDTVRAAVSAVDLVCEAAGTTANRLDSPLERAARDVRAVRGHVTVAPQHIDDGGRVLLGLPAEEMMLRS